MRPSHRVAIGAGAGAPAFSCGEDVNVLAAMEKARCTAIAVGCRNGGCGACRVLVTAGEYAVRKMNRAVVSEADEAAGCVLACRLYPRGDITVLPLGRAWRAGSSVTPASSHSGLAMTATSKKPLLET